MVKLQALTDSFVNLDETGTLDMVKSHLAKGDKPQDLFAALSEGMNVVGQKYGSREYFLAELVMAAEIFQEGMQALQHPHPRQSQSATPPSVIVGSTTPTN
jgi:methanogenic corrinoid protein MtbC1